MHTSEPAATFSLFMVKLLDSISSSEDEMKVKIVSDNARNKNCCFSISSPIRSKKRLPQSDQRWKQPVVARRYSHPCLRIPKRTSSSCDNVVLSSSEGSVVLPPRRVVPSIVQAEKKLIQSRIRWSADVTTCPLQGYGFDGNLRPIRENTSWQDPIMEKRLIRQSSDRALRIPMRVSITPTKKKPGLRNQLSELGDSIHLERMNKLTLPTDEVHKME